jgi:hypothetical protein
MQITLKKTLVWKYLQFYKVEGRSFKRKFLKICFKVKVKVTPWNVYASAKWRRKYIPKRFATLALEESGWSEPRRSRFTRGKYLTPIVQEAGCASESVRKRSENLACTRIRSPVRPARRKSLFRPSAFRTVSFLKQWFISSQVFRESVLCTLIYHPLYLPPTLPSAFPRYITWSANSVFTQNVRDNFYLIV